MFALLKRQCVGWIMTCVAGGALLVPLALAEGKRAAVDAEAKTADWPVFRGNPLQTGVAGTTLPEQLGIRWQFATKDSVEGAAAIAKGTVYVASYDEHLYAIDLATGQQKWKYKAAPFKASPSYHAGAVYVGDADGIFHCVDATTGQKRWSFETGSEIISGASFAGPKILFGSGDETLYCLSVEGQSLWKFKVPGGPVLASPAVVGNHTFVSGCDSALHVIDLATGKELRSVQLEGQTGATPAVAGDQLFVGTMTNQMLGIDWQKGEVAWRFEPASNSQPFYASAAVTDNLVVAASRDKRIYGLDRKSGKQVWKFATQGRVDSSPVVVGTRVFVGSGDGNLYVLDLARGTELTHFELATNGKGARGISASPAVGEHCLVIGTNEGTVYCLGAKK
jgi:outer membrane protein assembly factor BamB